MRMRVALAALEIVTTIVFLADWSQNPDDVISESLYAHRGFRMLLSFCVWLHLGLFAAAHRHDALTLAAIAAAGVGWFLVVAFDNRTGVVVHWVGVAVFCLASLAAALATIASKILLGLIAADAVLAAVYMSLAVQRNPQAAPIQRAAFLLLLGIMACAIHSLDLQS